MPNAFTGRKLLPKRTRSTKDRKQKKGGGKAEVMSGILIAITTCSRLRRRADAQRMTWIPFVRGADVRFFIGRGSRKSRPDEVVLDVPDDYLSLPYKSRAMFRWALDHDYDGVFKTDDDCYVSPGRLMESGMGLHHYIGPLSTGKSSTPYASGFAYWVSRYAMGVLSGAEINDTAEDRWVGTTLAGAHIKLHRDDRYVVVNSLRPCNEVTEGGESPRRGNDVIAAAEFGPTRMLQVHKAMMV